MKNKLQTSCSAFLALLLVISSLFLSSCDGVGTRTEPVIISFSPEKDIVVTDGQSIQFTVVTSNDAAAKFVWIKLRANEFVESNYDLTTASVNIPFTLEDNGSSIGVRVYMPSGATDGAGTGPIKVVPK
jgi:hypothetical protein